MQYIVVVTDRKINGRYVLECLDGGRLPIGLEQKSPALEVNNPEGLMRFDAANMVDHWNIFFAKDEATAKSIANEISQASPIKNVFWAKLLGAFESVPSKPVEKAITEKGVLPV